MDAPYAYLETSALLRALMEDDCSVREQIELRGACVTSELTWLEAERALIRAVAENRITSTLQQQIARWIQKFSERISSIQLSTAILERAKRAFAVEPVRSLDAIHIASLLFWDDEIGVDVVFSCDRRVRDNAAAFGFDVVPH